MPYPYYNNPYQYYQNQYYQNPYQQAQMQNVQQPMQQNAQQMQPVQQTQPQIQNGGFISVQNIDVARNWPVAPGNSVTFKDESAPYIYTKTMGYNQLDTPRFERFRLVKEEEASQTPGNGSESVPKEKPVDLSGYVQKAELEPLQDEIDGIKKWIEEFTEKKPPLRTKREVRDDE